MASSSSSKPAILLVQGVCHTVACFDDIKQRFEALSYDVFCRDLPSVGDASKSHTDDRDALIQCIEPQLDQGREFVLLAHSYGSIPGVAACENQTVEERAAAGKKGGIRLVIMICCGAVVRKGQTMLGEAGGSYPPYLMPKDCDKTDGLAHPTPVSPNFFYSDLPEDQAKYYTALLRPQSIASCEEPVGFGAADLAIPVYYLLCENDQALPAFVQQRACDNIPSLKRKLTWASGHFPFLSEPERFVHEMVGIIESETT